MLSHGFNRNYKELIFIFSNIQMFFIDIRITANKIYALYYENINSKFNTILLARSKHLQ